HAAMPLIEAGVSTWLQTPDQFPVGDTEAVYEGEPLAVVVAHTRGAAADGAALVEMDLEPLAPVLDLDRAVESGADVVRTGTPHNLAWDIELPGSGDIEAAFAKAHVVVRTR